MFSWILALLLALVVWSLATAWFWLVKRRRKETRLGLNALAGMHWRDFSEIVRRAMREQRGLQDVPGEVDDSRAPRSDFLMDDGQHRWLLSCKHGRAYRIGTAAVNELGAAARLAGARGGILITEGMVERDGRTAAEKQGVEVLDGNLLWPLLQPYLPGDMEARVKNEARREAIRRISIAALGSLTLGLLVGMGYMTARLDNDNTAAVPAAQPARAVAPAPVTVPAAATPPAAPHATAAAVGGIEADPDPATLARYQKELTRTLAGQAGVVSAFWLTRQTLSINRSGEIDAMWPRICAEVKRYPALRTVRIQLNPRPGVDEPVRWRQCTTL
ncbi:restriction endonuclease [Stenotrophomonas rhizophila]|uniref:restriction endonuclease n=1 Tax=Stenotrophomonas rhizophila TaxID=216778 RepID=UPI001E366078|nr:restriction endonuclease [Stenotrophomonas rhizophila]MCC7635550.1 restriction endonuclease [Stenotrophomonas rhizophila]MCC7664684.1 restriction endonuclease [Stenotrophomonas rhizophila]